MRNAECKPAGIISASILPATMQNHATVGCATRSNHGGHHTAFHAIPVTARNNWLQSNIDSGISSGCQTKSMAACWPSEIFLG